MRDWLAKFVGTRRPGKGELWLDPLGNTAEFYDCELIIQDNAVRYSWHYENELKQGVFLFEEAKATWSDSWHQSTPVECAEVPNAWGMFTVFSEYEAPGNPNWGWRSKLSERPDGSLVLQMTNIAPWGEEARAVRMIFEPV